MTVKVTAGQIFTNPIHFLAFGFGSGLAPKAPGTVGTLIAIPLFWLASDLSLVSYLTLVFGMTLGGVFLCHQSSKSLGVHDHPGIVWDEIVGYFITMIGFSFTWMNVAVGFALFRLFDIVKPWPIKWADKKVDGGLGIMLDDIIAGLFAWGGLLAFNYFWSSV